MAVPSALQDILNRTQKHRVSCVLSFLTWAERKKRQGDDVFVVVVVALSRPPPAPPAHHLPAPSFTPLQKQQHAQGVVGYVLSGPDGAVVATTLAPGLARAYASAAPALGRAARATARDLDPRDDQCFLRLRTARHELAVAAS